MDCPTCQDGDVFLHVERDADRARMECGGAIGPGRSCGWHGDWMTYADAEAQVQSQCEALRGYALIVRDLVAAREDPPSHRAPVHPLMPTGDERAA